jgi:hypothetical protein
MTPTMLKTGLLMQDTCCAILVFVELIIAFILLPPSYCVTALYPNLLHIACQNLHTKKDAKILFDAQMFTHIQTTKIVCVFYFCHWNVAILLVRIIFRSEKYFTQYYEILSE